MEVDEEKRRRFWAYSIVGFLIIISLWYYSVNPLYMYIIAYLWFGFAYGILLQYGRFCFASAWRDLIAIRVTRMFVGIMIAMGVFSIVMAALESVNMSTFHPGPLGLHELLGGLLFGLGMVFAGGCASGTLYKSGEGNGTSLLIVLPAMMFSQAVFVDFGGYFDKFLRGYVFKHKAITLDKFFQGMGAEKYFIGNALINAIIPILILLAVVYVLVARKTIIKRIIEEKRSSADGGSVEPSLQDELRGFWRMITASRRTAVAGIVLGIISGVHVLVIQGLRNKYGIHNFGEVLRNLGFAEEVAKRGVFDPGYWYITTQEAQLGAWVLKSFGFEMKDNIFFGVMNGIPEPWRNPALLMSIGLIVGATVMALINNEFKFKLPNRELVAWGLIGGTLMGIGARVALGCNIGAFYIRVAGGDPGGWLFFAGMGAGAFVAVKTLNWWTERKMLTEFEIIE